MKTTLGKLKYSILLLERSKRKNTDLCPICKNGQGCVNVFIHGKYWT